jgi:sugar/nucleoside kinase (ribokinase family)
MSTNNCNVLCYGGIAIESIIVLPYQPKPGIAHIICEEQYRLGGGAANVAEWLGSWAVPTRLSGNVIGYDQYGDKIWNWLNDYPVIDLQFLKRGHEINTLISRSIPFPDGNRYLLCSDFANASFVPPVPKMLKNIQVLDIAFYNRNLKGNAAAAEIGKLAHAKGISIVAMDVISTSNDTLPLADIIINSASSIIEHYPSINVLEHSKDLQSINKGIVITTDGSHKLTAIDKDGTLYSLLPPKVLPTDTTGAGDSFRAGIIYGHLKGWSLARSLKWAAAVGALQVQRSFFQEPPPSKRKIASIAKDIEVQRIS